MDSRVTLPELEPFADDVLSPGQDYDGVQFRGLDLAAQQAIRARFRECALVDCSLDDADLSRARIVECVLEELRATTIDLSSAVLEEVDARQCRFGACVGHGGAWRRVRFTGIRFDYVNLRSAELVDVTFEGCEFGEIDIADGVLTRVRFADCRLDRLELSGAGLSEVDLSSSQLRELGGLDSIAGAVISHDQLLELAPTFAQHLGVRVVSAEGLT